MRESPNKFPFFVANRVSKYLHQFEPFLCHLSGYVLVTNFSIFKLLHFGYQLIRLNKIMKIPLLNRNSFLKKIHEEW